MKDIILIGNKQEATQTRFCPCYKFYTFLYDFVKLVMCTNWLYNYAFIKSYNFKVNLTYSVHLPELSLCIVYAGKIRQGLFCFGCISFI